MMIDSGKKNTASRIAAGMFSSISGKRKTVDEEMLEKQKFAIAVYRQMEKLLQQKFLHEENIHHLFHSEIEKVETLERIKDENFSRQIQLNPVHIENIKDEHGAIEIKNSGWLNCSLMLNVYRDYLTANNSYTVADFNYNTLEIKNNKFCYHDFEAANIIFCEGYHANKNPFFKDETIIPCKGDVLTLQHANKGNKNIVKRNGCYLVPADEDTIKAGSTYLWNNDDEQLLQSGSDEIKKNVSNILADDYKIINHETAIRPTTKNRAVIAKRHPLHKNMFMLNGLGTKGVVQAPWYANYISEKVSI